MDRQAQLPLPLLKEMLDAGLFRLWLPEELGGYSVDPPIALKVIEAMARIDGSAGWCMGPGNVSGLFAAYLPETAAREIYSGDWLMNGAGSIAGSGTAIPVEGRIPSKRSLGVLHKQSGLQLVSRRSSRSWRKASRGTLKMVRRICVSSTSPPTRPKSFRHGIQADCEAPAAIICCCRKL